LYFSDRPKVKRENLYNRARAPISVGDFPARIRKTA